MRLIDADALKEEFNNIASEAVLGDMQLVPICSFISFIDNAQTISPYKAIHDELHKGEEE